MDPQIIWLDRDGVPHLRNSERGTLNKCPQRWWWSWRDGLRPKETAKALWFGEGIHLALAHYYAPGRKRRKDFIDVWRAFADEEAEYVRANIGGIDEDKWVEARVLGEHMLQNYVKEYAHDRNWDVIATEQNFSVRIPVLGRNDKPSMLQKKITKAWGDYFILNGTFDGVYRDTDDKRIKLMEHKTAGSISTRHLPMDNQAGTYWMVAFTVLRELGVLASNEQIQAIMYNFLRKAMADERPKDAQGYATNKPSKQDLIDALDPYVEWPTGPRGGIKYPTIEAMEAKLAALKLPMPLGERSKSQPPPLFERHPVRRTKAMRATQLNRLRAEYVHMGAYILGELEVTKSPSRDTCPMCPFSEMCELHESGGDWVTFRDAVYRSEDLYVMHRKSA